MSLRDKLPFGSDPMAELEEALFKLRGDADAIALLPYDDGTFFPKPANFDKTLIGGQGGYETDDGDKIVVDGEGEAIRSLFGVPVLLAVDPTEHAAAVDPIKALIAHKEDIGEWLRVDRDGNVVQAGPGIEPAPNPISGDELEEAVEQIRDEELLELVGVDTADMDAGDMAAAVGANEEEIKAALRETFEHTADVDANGIVADGGLAGQMVEQSGGQIGFDEAMRQLAEAGKLSKIYDIAPPAAPVEYVSEDGTTEVAVEEATHIAVDQSKAADLLPKTTSTVELNTALDKARMEEHDAGAKMKFMIYGVLIGAVTVGITGIVMFLMYSFVG